MNAQITIASEIARRQEIIENKEFRQQVRDWGVSVGVTPEEWSRDSAMLYLMFANEICGLQNKAN